jgi:predicted aspartyl protease
MPAFSAESADLEADGPVVEVSFSLVRTARDAIGRAGEAVPAAVPASALIDTGASGTVVQAGLLSSLGLNPISVVNASTPTTTVPVPLPVYAVGLLLPNGYLEVTVVEAPLGGQNIQALIGRDVLKYGIFIYQGHTSQFTLSF